MPSDGASGILANSDPPYLNEAQSAICKFRMHAEPGSE